MRCEAAAGNRQIGEMTLDKHRPGTKWHCHWSEIKLKLQTIAIRGDRNVDSIS